MSMGKAVQNYFLQSQFCQFNFLQKKTPTENSASCTVIFFKKPQQKSSIFGRDDDKKPLRNPVRPGKVF